MHLSISITMMLPRGFNVYIIQFSLGYYLNLLQISEKQAKPEVAQKQNLVKVVETKLRVQYIKNKLQELKEIAVFMIYMIVVPENCGN